MSYSTTALGVPLEWCSTDYDCDPGELCCESYCRIGDDIEQYCARGLVEMLSDKPTPKAPAPIVTTKEAGLGIVTVVGVAAVAGLAVWLWGESFR